MKKAFQALFLTIVLGAASVFPQSPQNPPAPEESRSTIAVVNFEESGTAPTPASASALDSLAPTLAQHPARRYELHGYLCPGPDNGSSARAAGERVKAIGNFLVASGVPTGNIKAVKAGSAEAGSCARVAIVAVEANVGGVAAKSDLEMTKSVPVTTAKPDSVSMKPEPVTTEKSDSIATTPEPVATAKPAAKPQIITEEFRTLLAVVNFDGNSVKPTAFSAAALDSVSAVIKQEKNRRYEVHGFHCQGTGGQGASAQRAGAMFGYLTANGVPEASISTIVRGSAGAEASNSATESCSRVEIVSIETRQREVAPEPEPEPEPVAIAKPEPEPEPEPKVEPIPPDSQGRPILAIYMAGEEPPAAKGSHYILGSELARTISESDKYLAVDRTEDIQAQIAKEHIYQREGGVDDDQIKELGMQLGAQYLCIGNIKDVGKRSYYLDVRLVDVVTAQIQRTVTANSNLKDAAEKTRVAKDIAYELIETDKARAARKRKKVIFLSTSIGLDVLGVGAVAYGYLEDDKVVKERGNTFGGIAADKAAMNRNIAYIVGGAMIASGVTIHILF